jgi:3-oxoacyl-[acyl-carrier-protein] synthase III
MLWVGGERGFSGSASIPACLSEQLESGVVQKGQLILSLAVGAGMNCAGALYYA